MSCVLTGVVPLGLVLLLCGAQGFFLPNVTHLEKLLSKYQQDQPHSRARRAISRTDREEILMLHNKLRGQVSPPASNMEYMVSSGPGAGPVWGLGAGAGEGHRLGSGLGAHLAVGGTPVARPAQTLSPGAVLVPWPPCSVASTPLFKCSLCPHSEGQLSLSSGAFCWEEEAEKGHWRVPCTSREAPALRNRRSNQLQVPVPSSTFTHVSPCLVFSAP